MSIMKTTAKLISSIIMFVMLLCMITACSKKKKGAVVSNTSAISAIQKLEAAINARVGIFNVTGIVDVNVYTAFDGKQITITKLSPSKIRIQAVNFSMGVYELEVQNGATVSNGVVSGSDDGKAIGYNGPSPNGNITFSCEEDDDMALVVTGTGIHNVSIVGSK
jgi:hypothetical protein